MVVIRVLLIGCGDVALRTADLLRGRVRLYGLTRRPEDIPKLRNHCPLGRLGTESEVSAAVCFLLSDAAGYITGTEIRIDGGTPLGNRSMPLEITDKSKPFNGFHLAKTPKVLGG